MIKLDREFYSRETLIVAKDLLGKILVHHTNGYIVKGKIVETEAYLGLNDKACHSYGGKISKRVATMYDKAGTAYVYFIWGKYSCFNVITVKKGVPEGVLIRAIAPVENKEQMIVNRFNKNHEELSQYQKKNISNGPGKLTLSLNIDRKLNEEDLCGDKLYLERGQEEKFNIIETKRIGIDYAQEAIDYPYRFYIEDSPYVSKR